MFGRKKAPKAVPFDKTGKIPVIRASICTGEQVAGFKDTGTQKFTEIMLIRNDADLQTFLQRYDVQESELRREW